MKRELGIQVYSVFNHMQTKEDVESTFKKLASYGYTQIHTAGEFSFGVEEYARLAKESGLEVMGTHVSMDILEDIDEAVRIHKILGTTNAGVGSMPKIWGENFSKQDVFDFIKRANIVAEGLGKHGMKFTYHHHWMEFAKIGNDTIMDLMYKELNPTYTSFVLDPYWMQEGGVNILEWIEKYQGRLDILHLKDKGMNFAPFTGCITELGSGNINFKEVIRVANETGVKYLCYEQDNNHKVDSLESAKQSAEYFFSIV